MDFIKIGNYIFAVNTIERMFIRKEQSDNDAPSYFIYVATHDEEIRTTEHETMHWAECEIDDIYKKLNDPVIHLS